MIDELGSTLFSGNQLELLKKKSAIGLQLKQQLLLIAMSLDDFVQLNLSIRVSHIILMNIRGTKNKTNSTISSQYNDISLIF